MVLPMSNTLVLPNITMEDTGVYRCKAELEPQKHNVSTANVAVFGEHPKNCCCWVQHYHITVILIQRWLNFIWFKSFVLEHPFLNITYKNERLSTVTVKEGRKKVVFEPKVNALPPAVVLGWWVRVKNMHGAHGQPDYTNDVHVCIFQVQGWRPYLEKFHLF